MFAVLHQSQQLKLNLKADTEYILLKPCKHTLTKVHMGENSTHNAQEPSDKINPTEIH